MSDERDYETEARSQGWVPEDEWKGDNPPEFVDAKTFVERGEKIPGILKSKINNLEGQVQNLTKTNAEFRQYHEKQLSKERQAKERAIKELEDRRAQAVTDGDGQAYTNLDREINTLREEVNTIPSSQTQSVQNDPLVQAWLVGNSWYNDNPKLKYFADGVAEQIVSEGYSGQAYLTELANRVKATFPEEFEATRAATPTVESPQASRVSESNDHSYDGLPADAKAMCDRFIRDIPGFTKEQFVAEYDWD